MNIERRYIVGPCAAESAEQMSTTVTESKARGISQVRVSLWKPRTKDGGFDGLKEEGLPLYTYVLLQRLVPWSEVMLPEHADILIDTATKTTDNTRPIGIWLGSRNQNHLIQKEVGRIAGQAGERASILLKNQPWSDKEHWLGIISHVISGGADPKQIILCHRGFAPGKDGYRYYPDFEMATDVKKITGMPMLIDASHIGGDIEKVKQVISTALEYKSADGLGFEGLMLEVHPNPDQAKTDRNQQLSYQQLDQILRIVA